MRFITVFCILSTVFFSCKKESITPPEPLPEAQNQADTNGFLEIHIENTCNNLPVDLQSTSTYTNTNGDTYSISTLMYYISNVKLYSSLTDSFIEAESYYLVNQANSNSLHLMVKGVPRKNYDKISFLIGVDSKRNTSGAQTGALDPIHGMFWTWSTGYIMAKLEGSSPQSGAANQGLAFHIGGFSGVNSAVRQVNLNFPNTANVTPTHTPVLTLNADINSWFGGSSTIDFSTVHTVTSVSATSKSIADNYANMFNVISVVN